MINGHHDFPFQFHFIYDHFTDSIKFNSKLGLAQLTMQMIFTSNGEVGYLIMLLSFWKDLFGESALVSYFLRNGSNSTQ